MSDPDFYNKTKQKWNTLRSAIWSDSNLRTFIDNTKTYLEESEERNFNRWGDIGGFKWLTPKACTNNSGTKIYCNTYDDIVNIELKSWIINRAHWIDGALQ